MEHSEKFSSSWTTNIDFRIKLFSFLFVLFLHVITRHKSMGAKEFTIATSVADRIVECSIYVLTKLR